MKKVSNELYMLYINGQCLKCDSINSFSQQHCENSVKFLYNIVYIEKAFDYNLQIESNQINGNKQVNENDDIKYPFYLIVPISLRGYSVKYTNKEDKRLISITHTSDSVEHRFKKIDIFSD